ncbi:DNA repair protein RecO [Treponema brennaborense]|uniref:DNA repair protein RecO n=1 Tax=Treponema brennaborense (strain DSM 12168 / CIP 105900 / DD5/3) TaxID=906968 RepID=F4LKE7_TREBD|nr:DNA repair protein RecO [Treponema brennaborense]AEE16521.1 DNA repair protein recO [Treponema brennaborense DSM 12168]
MSRHSSVSALVLTSRQAGEDNRIITLLSPVLGVFDAMLYGGRKSKLRALVSPWHSGTVWLYTDESKKSIKITDFDPNVFRPSLRENLFKNMAASLATELAVKTKAAGEYGSCWTLVCAFLDGLEFSSEAEGRTGLLRFLWRYLGLLGVKPDADCCVRCGSPLTGTQPDEEGRQAAAESVHNPSGCAIVYSAAENGFICRECTGTSDTGFHIPEDGVRYLQTVDGGEPKAARHCPLTRSAFEQLRLLLFYLVSSAAGGKLKTLESGAGIL